MFRHNVLAALALAGGLSYVPPMSFDYAPLLPAVGRRPVVKSKRLRNAKRKHPNLNHVSKRTRRKHRRARRVA